MKNKLDKNSKLSSGKSKESSPSKKPEDKDAKSQASAKAESKPQPAASKKAKPAAAKPVETKASAKEKAPESKPKAAPKPVSTTPTSRPKDKIAAKKTAAARAETSKPKSEFESDEELSLEEFSIALTKPGETKERIWRTKSFHQMHVQREFGLPDVAPELPSQYNEPKLVLMPKDPEYMFCYWELTPSLIEEKEREKLADGNYRETLKINWESRSLFEPNFTFIPVFFWARKWYFGVPQVGQRYQVELGWLSDSGHFISIIRSNLSELPESWAATQKRLAEQGDVMAYSSKHTKILGSSENLMVEDVRAFAPEWNLSSESMSSSSWSRGPSQASEGMPGVAAATKAPATQAKKKAVEPKAKLEVSGKVLPGTLVHVSGNAVVTDPKGYFKTEFPYNQDVLNLELTSSSGATRSFTYDLKELVLT